MEDSVDFLDMLANFPNDDFNDFWCGNSTNLDSGSISPLSSDFSESSGDGSYNSQNRKRSRQDHDEKLQKNKEAAARCRLKRKQEQLNTTTLIADLENQLQTMKLDNSALRLENENLRSENFSLKSMLSKFTADNSRSISSVAVFGVICLFPILSGFSVVPSGLMESLLHISEYAVLERHGRVLLSVEGLLTTSSSHVALWIMLLMLFGCVLLCARMYKRLLADVLPSTVSDSLYDSRTVRAAVQYGVSAVDMLKGCVFDVSK